MKIVANLKKKKKLQLLWLYIRSSGKQVLYRIMVLKNHGKLPAMDFLWILWFFFIMTGLGIQLFQRSKLSCVCYPVDFVKFFRKAFLEENIFL